jgi:hypothetical protein
LGTLIEFVLEIHIKNPLEEKFDAVLMLSKARANVSFSVNSKL